MRQPFAIQRLRVSIVVLTLLLLASHARAATIFTFGVTGTNAYDTDPLSFSYDPAQSPDFIFIKPIDGSTADFALAAALGTTFPQATFIAYDTLIAPANELFRYSFLGALVTSWQVGGTTETVTLSAATITRSQGPAAIPEPATLLLFGTGLLGAGVRHWRKRQS